MDAPKFNVSDAKLFIWLMSKHADLYTTLQKAGYELIFKEVINKKEQTSVFSKTAEKIYFD